MLAGGTAQPNTSAATTPKTTTTSPVLFVDADRASGDSIAGNRLVSRKTYCRDSLGKGFGRALTLAAT